MAGLAEHRRVPGGLAAERVRGGLVRVVGLDLDDPAADAADEQGHADELGGDLEHGVREELSGESHGRRSG